jgi:hypothetical protein
MKTKNFEGVKLKKIKKLGGKILIIIFFLEGKFWGLVGPWPPGPMQVRPCHRQHFMVCNLYG